ncbi:MAG: L-threonine dehydrogenase [Firmicutes bacterium HGW-Firmicutes-15]|nr:MAG: L-threonine dehydrogenase [Firmicutes bacterium HGW-Firmicutes-15]
MENNHNFWLPKTNLIGIGAIKDLSSELLAWKLSKVLIVTDKNIISLGYVEIVEKILKSLFIFYDIFDGVLHPNPTVSFVEDGLACCDNSLLDIKKDYDLIISIGGGSNHDCAKAIATVATNGGSITDYEGWNKVTKPPIPQIAINTTAGSGAEITMSAVITDESRKVKMAISSPMMTPLLSVNDPLFMATMSQEVTASSGIDVVSHAIEAYVSIEASPISDALALGALELVFDYLPRAYDNGNDMEAREQMMFANIMAGMAFNTAGLGYVHALAHQIGGFYNVTHGNVNAVLLPHVLEFNAPSIPDERISRICEAIHVKATSKARGIELIAKGIMDLRSHLDIPSSLKEIGMESGDVEELSRNALKDLTSLSNPRKGTLQDIMDIYKSAF